MCTPNKSVSRNAWGFAVLAVALASGAGCGGSQASSSSSNTLPSIESPGASSTGSSARASDAADMPAPPAAASSSSVAPSPASSAPAAAADASESTGSGARDINDIRSAITASRDRFRGCYDQALKKHPGIEGKFVLHFVVHPNGSVKSADVDNAASQIHVDEMGPCAINVLKTLKFPVSKKGMESTVNYPFDFHPKGPTK